MMGGTVAFSIVLAVAIFMILPYYISVFFQKYYRFLYADRCFRGADPSGNFYRVCGSDFADA